MDLHSDDEAPVIISKDDHKRASVATKHVSIN